ncbi:hypothetical protein IJ670_04915 [bacterium]|nr:hypothetical protein [bacterium]
MSIRVSQNSFSKGILSPSLTGRIDLEYYNLGLKNLKNGIVLQEGCVINRSGLEFLAKTKFSNKKIRLIPFVFNYSQSYIIEAGDYYFRFIKDGGYVVDDNSDIYEIQTPYSANEVFELDYVQQADCMTLVHENHKPSELVRLNHNNWELNEIEFQANISPPTNLVGVYTGSTSSNTTMYAYVVTAVDKDTNEESARSLVAYVRGHLEAYWTTSEYITLDWLYVPNASEYNVYRSVNGIFAYIGTTNTTTFVDNNIEPDLSSCAPISQNPFENQNPSCVCYYQQRKIYGCSNLQPQTIWASNSGTDNNFNVSRPLNSTDAVSLTLHDNIANKIQSLISFDDLIVMSSTAEWCVNGADGVFCANPSPVAKLQSYYGSAKIKPVISGTMVLFVQSGGNIVRDLGYDYLKDSYDGEELTLLAGHLFEGKRIVDMAYSKEPYRILWCVMDDGTLNALTYNPKQKISSWHTHQTQGRFESVTVIRENNEDIAYFSIQREIDGQTVRYIERFKSRIIRSLENSFFLDCALHQEFENKVSTITGLDHLKNMDVLVLSDFGVVENLKVNSQGVLNLPYEAQNVTVGLPFTFELETLNLEGEGTLGLNKIVNKVEVQILNSREDFFIANDDGTYYQAARCHDSINNPKKTFNTIVEFCPLNNASMQKSVKIMQKFPLPLNILSISTTLSIGEVESV